MNYPQMNCPLAAMRKIGENLESCIIDKDIGYGWKVSCPAFDKDWEIILKSKDKKLYKTGDTDEFWVYNIDTIRHIIFLSDSDFGRLPISDRMRPRYIKALEAGIKLLSIPEDGLSFFPENLSELKGMFNRCVRKDQWDWFSVYSIFGYPPLSKLRKAAECLGELTRSVKNRDPKKCNEFTKIFCDFDLSSILTLAQKGLIEGIPRLSDAIKFKSDIEKEEDERLADGIDEQDPYIISQVSRVKKERANTSHKQVLNILVEFLKSKGFFVERSRFVDAYCRLKTGPAIFEVKSITLENERSQCRHALSQLYEYETVAKVR